MTAPDIEQDEIVDDAEERDAGPDALGEAEVVQIREALTAASAMQPTFHLLPMDQEPDWTGRDGDLHFLTIGDYHMIIDAAAKTIEPFDPEPLRQQAILRLSETYADGVPAGADGRSVTPDWTTLQILSEAEGVATATVDAADGGQTIDLTIDLEWNVTVAPLDETEESTVDGVFLGGYYGDSEFPFDGKHFVVTWTTWEIDQTTDDGMVGGRCTATSDGVEYELYAWFSADTGFEVVEATATGDAPADSDADTEAEGGHGITKEYLKDYYGSDRLEFDGAGMVVDWDTWDPDQVTDEGLVGSPAKGTDDNGVEHELYIWFDPAEGAEIVSATPVETPDAAPKDEVDPSERFDTVVVPDLRDFWTRNDRTLRDTSGKEYDVSAWLDGDSDSEPVYESFDGDHYFLTMKMSTVGDEATRVQCRLKVRDVEEITVEDEKSA